MIGKFDDIRPYEDFEIPAAMRRISDDKMLPVLASVVFPSLSIDEVKAILSTIKNVYDFQSRIMYYAINKIEDMTTSGVIIKGLENLSKDKGYLFVSNHRDIVLDSAFLQTKLHDAGFRTTQITFGSNLMKPPVIVDIGKSNKMFKVNRVGEGNVRQLINDSNQLSEYIRYVITAKNESVWIAQRDGRTKDGNDTTKSGLIKMFAMSNRKTTPLESLLELNIVPIAISYQIEPCDILKTREMYLSSQAPYVKSADEDIQSIKTGIMQMKGNVVIKVLPTLNSIIDRIEIIDDDIYKSVALLIDKQIHAGYHLHDTNYMAFDLLNNSSSYSSYYTPENMKAFVDRMNDGLSFIDGNIEVLKEMYLKMYSNPILNSL